MKVNKTKRILARARSAIRSSRNPVKPARSSKLEKALPDKPEIKYTGNASSATLLGVAGLFAAPAAMTHMANVADGMTSEDPLRVGDYGGLTQAMTDVTLGLASQFAPNPFTNPAGYESGGTQGMLPFAIAGAAGLGTMSLSLATLFRGVGGHLSPGEYADSRYGRWGGPTRGRMGASYAAPTVGPSRIDDSVSRSTINAHQKAALEVRDNAAYHTQGRNEAKTLQWAKDAEKAAQRARGGSKVRMVDRIASGATRARGKMYGSKLLNTLTGGTGKFAFAGSLMMGVGGAQIATRAMEGFSSAILQTGTIRTGSAQRQQARSQAQTRRSSPTAAGVARQAGDYSGIGATGDLVFAFHKNGGAGNVLR